MIVSNWKFTYDPLGTPLVLLDYGALLADEIVWSIQRGMEVVQLVDSAAPFLRASGNSVVSISFKVSQEESADSTARTKMLDSIIAVDALIKKPLKVQAYGVIATTYWTFANAYITGHEATPDRDAAASALYKSYTITATGLGKTTA